MLSLDDTRWYELQSDYSGPHKFLPALRQLAVDPESAPGVVREFVEHDYVCHQRCPCQTALAVVPHFIHAAGRLPPAARVNLLGTAWFYALLIGVPAAAVGGMALPGWLADDYHQAVWEALPLTGEALAAAPSGEDPESDQLRLTMALAAFHGRRTGSFFLSSGHLEHQPAQPDLTHASFVRLPLPGRLALYENDVYSHIHNDLRNIPR